MRWDGLLLEFRFQYLDDFLCLFQLQVGTGGDLFDGQFQHALGRVAAAGFQGVDHPAVDLVGKFGECNVFLLDFAVNIDIVAGQHLRKPDIQTALADGERYLVGLEIDRSCLLLLVDGDARNLRGVQGTLDH